MSGISREMNDLVLELVVSTVTLAVAPTDRGAKPRADLRRLIAHIAAIEAERDVALARLAKREAQIGRLRNILWDAGEDEKLDSFRFGGHLAKHLKNGDWADPITTTADDLVGGER